jgi:hypothetical protein
VTDQGGEMVRNKKEKRKKDEGSTARMNRLWRSKRSGLFEIQDHTSRSTTNNE